MLAVDLPNEIVLRQNNRIWGRRRCGKSLPHPTWDYVPPTQSLQERGLTAEALQQELKLIHAKSAQSFEPVPNDCSCALLWLPSLLMCMMFVFIVTTSVTGLVLRSFILWFFSGLLCACCLCCIQFSCSTKRAEELMHFKAKQALEQIQKYITLDLNKKYEYMRIQWAWQEEMIRCGQAEHVIVYHHIVVSCKHDASPIPSEGDTVLNVNDAQDAQTKLVAVQFDVAVWFYENLFFASRYIDDYCSKFKHNGYDNVDSICEITRDELQRIGIVSAVHQSEILRAIERMVDSSRDTASCYKS
eukprot:CAMPEP_0197040708 /NCGR_PEP_ID=MMETSP1384-20130603/17373_1 /TAXON_ID=29189 /ORGANISM="Ammonia sp." /LENGTH=300 /DNA_ID=CAMNT_0042471513 /DNA_START=46 /DNA_END=948 /DNA_ORIENTATION=-